MEADWKWITTILFRSGLEVDWKWTGSGHDFKRNESDL